MQRILLALAVFLLAPLALAQETAPDVLVKSVSQEVLDIIRKDKDIQSGNTKKTIDLVETKVLPHFDFARMTALAMGPNWRRATPEQQKVLTDQFRTLLVRTYSTALSSYKNHTIDFKPLRSQPGDSDVIVRSEVKQPGQQAVSIDYSMEKTAANWKVYDVAVGGVSLVTTYRDTFTNEVRQGGIDGLIKSLGDKNRQLETAEKK
ncbi:MAG: ABC transporter substrate-binding protein [Burkholderiales bacterium]|jgi:phospholipid transport system substrate-binding protein|nr:ABC transporter substrate-binding protein [Burkholderiales bacterium]